LGRLDGGIGGSVVDESEEDEGDEGDDVDDGRLTWTPP
jgi:hypothetical protein